MLLNKLSQVQLCQTIIGRDMNINGLFLGGYEIRYGKPGMDYFLFGGSGLLEDKGGISGFILIDPHDNHGDAKILEDPT